MHEPLLVVRRGALGDTLLMIPVLRALRAQEPQRPLHFAGNLDFAVLLSHFGIVDRALSSEDLQLWRRPAPAGALVEGRDFDPRLGPECSRPAAEELLLRVRAARPALPCVDPVPRLLDSRRPLAPGHLRVLAPGAGAPRKRRPLAEFVALATAPRVAVVLGEAEREFAREVRAAMPGEVEYWQELPLVELATRLARAAEYFGNDSGITHLAACLLVPTTAMFVASDPRVWAPRGDHVRVV